MDIGKEIEDLKRRFDALGASTNWGGIYDYIKMMFKTMAGNNEDGKSIPDEEWVAGFESLYGTRKDFIKSKEPEDA